MSLIAASQGLGKTVDLTIEDVDGDTITPGVHDKVRVTIGRLNETSVFTVTSGTATANGSSITKGAANRLRMDAQDLAEIDPGIYSLQVDYYDNADAQEWKLVSAQVFSLEGSL